MLDDNHDLVEVAYSLISTGTKVTGVKRSGESLAKKAIQQPENIKKVLNILKEKALKRP